MKRLFIIVFTGVALASCKAKVEHNDIAPSVDTIIKTQNSQTKSPTPKTDTVVVSDTLGIDISTTTGFVILHTTETADSIVFLNADKTVWLSVSGNWQGEQWSDDFDSWAFDLVGEGIVIMRCVGSVDGLYTVITNEQTLTTHIIEHSYATEFIDWEQYFAMGSLVADTILADMDDSAAHIDTGDMDLTIVEVNGEWLRVEATYNSSVDGYVHWQHNGRLLPIKFLLQ